MGILRTVKFKEYTKSFYKTLSVKLSDSLKELLQPDTDDSSVSLSEKCSIARLLASGDGDLCDGGVGSDAEGEAAEILASREGELGPSKMRWANTKQAVAVIFGGYNMHSGVLYLRDVGQIKHPEKAKNERVMRHAPRVIL